MLNFLKSICPPALIYLVFSMTQIIIDTYKGLYNVSLIKFIVMVFFTLLLNLLCMNGLGIVSWIIVFVPFILMSVITALLLLFFDLNTTTGKIQKKHPHKHHHHPPHGHHHKHHHGHHHKHHHGPHHKPHHGPHHKPHHGPHHKPHHLTIYEDDQGNYSYDNNDKHKDEQKHEHEHKHKHEQKHEHEHNDIKGHTLNNKPKKDTNSIYNNMIKETNDIFPF